MKIKKGDKIQIIKGIDRVRRTKKGDKTSKGNQGKVLRVLPVAGKIIVEGLNLRYKHVRPRRQGEKGQRIQFPAAFRVENVMLVCPQCSKPTRVGYKLLSADAKGKKKIRICRRCQAAID